MIGMNPEAADQVQAPCERGITAGARHRFKAPGKLRAVRAHGSGSPASDPGAGSEVSR